MATCRRAAAALDRLAAPNVDINLVALSRWYRTAPLPASPGQPDYVNGVAQLRGIADPAALLAALHALEHAEGRRRGEPNAARSLDLDIIAIDAMLRDAPDPVLPHPRAHLRAFVLAPLADLAPDWVHPRLGHTARALLAALPTQRIEVL